MTRFERESRQLQILDYTPAVDTVLVVWGQAQHSTQRVE